MSITTLKALSEKLSQELTRENFRFLDGALRAYGEKEVRYAACTLIANFVAALIYRTLTEAQALNQSKGQHEERILNNTSELKRQIQDAIANAFQNSMSTFSGNYVEYYCTVKPVPDSPSKLPN